MEKNKKIVSIVVAVVAAILIFLAGFFFAGKLSKKTATDAVPETTLQQETDEGATDDSADEDEGDESVEDYVAEYLYILEDEKFGTGEFKVSRAEYEYYCVSIYNSLVSSAAQYDYYYGEGAGLYYVGFDWKKLPADQECPIKIDKKEFKNYDEYIDYLAVEQIKATKACVDYAKLNSITFTEEEQTEIDNYIQESRESCEAEGTDLETYLKEYFGAGMTEEIYINIVNERYLVNKVDNIKLGLLEIYFTDEMVEDEYNNNVNLYSQVTLRNYIIAAATDESGAVYEASMEAAKKEATVFADLVTDEKSFIVRASDKEKKSGNEQYAEILVEDNYTILKNIGYDELEAQTDDENFAKWAFDPSRKTGETYIAKIEGVGYGVYMMVNPVHKPAASYTYDVRHILVQFPEDSEKDTTTKIKLLNPADYNVTVDINIYPDITADHALYMQAQGILEEYLSGDCTEESFSALAKKYSADGNADSGGIYSDVPEGQMVSAFENWALEKNRAKGDVGIVETTYGYHVMYFVGRKALSDWKDTVREEMVLKGSDEFIVELSDGYELKVEGGSDSELTELYQANIDYYASFFG